MSPFGSPKGGRVARPNEAKRRRRRVVQVDPSHGGTDARVPRQGRWRGSVAALASRAHGRPGIVGLHPAASRAPRGWLNGFPGALAGVLRHRIGGSRRRVSDTSATGRWTPLRSGSQPTLWGHASRVPGRGWRGWLRPLRSPGRPRSGRPWRARGRQVARIGGNLNHLGAVSGLVERRRRPHWDDLPSHLV